MHKSIQSVAPKISAGQHPSPAKTHTDAEPGTASGRSRPILDAAYELLEQHGLDGLTIRAVLMRTRLARRAFYERFSGKDDLLLAVFEHTILLTVKHCAEQVAAVSDPMQRLKLILTCLVQGTKSLNDTEREQFNRRGAAMSREHMRLAESRPRDLQAALSPLIELICSQVREGMKTGQVRTCDPQFLATLLYNVVSTTAHARFLAEEAAHLSRTRRVRVPRDDRLATEIWDFCRRAIASGE